MLRGEAHIAKKRFDLLCRLQMRGGKLQMIALFGIGHTSAGEKRAAQKRRAAALLLQQGKIDMQRKMRLSVVAKRAEDGGELVLVRDAKHQLSAVLFLRQGVKADGKRLLKEPGKPCGKLLVFRHDTHLADRKAVGIEQYAVRLGDRAAVARKRGLADLRFHLIGKGHRVHPP